MKAIMCLYEGATTKVRVSSVVFDKFSVKIGVHQDFILSLLLFATAVDVVMENARNGVLHIQFLSGTKLKNSFEKRWFHILLLRGSFESFLQCSHQWELHQLKLKQKLRFLMENFGRQQNKK